MFFYFWLKKTILVFFAFIVIQLSYASDLNTLQPTSMVSWFFKNSSVNYAGNINFNPQPIRPSAFISTCTVTLDENFIDGSDINQYAILVPSGMTINPNQMDSIILSTICMFIPSGIYVDTDSQTGLRIFIKPGTKEDSYEPAIDYNTARFLTLNDLNNWVLNSLSNYIKLVGDTVIADLGIWTPYDEKLSGFLSLYNTKIAQLIPRIRINDDQSINLVYFNEDNSLSVFLNPYTLTLVYPTGITEVTIKTLSEASNVVVDDFGKATFSLLENVPKSGIVTLPENATSVVIDLQGFKLNLTRQIIGSVPMILQNSVVSSDFPVSVTMGGAIDIRAPITESTVERIDVIGVPIILALPQDQTFKIPVQLLQSESGNLPAVQLTLPAIINEMSLA